PADVHGDQRHRRPRRPALHADGAVPAGRRQPELDDARGHAAADHAERHRRGQPRADLRRRHGTEPRHPERDRGAPLRPGGGPPAGAQPGGGSAGHASVPSTPAADYPGSDSSPFTVNDAGLTQTGTISITVTPVNAAPLAASQSVVTPEDTPLLITLAGTDID